MLVNGRRFLYGNITVKYTEFRGDTGALNFKPAHYVKLRLKVRVLPDLKYAVVLFLYSVPIIL